MGVHAHGSDDCTGPGHSHEAPRSGSWITFALVLTGGFAAVEAIAGYLAQSLALMSDAAHMVTDVGALAVSGFALWMSRRPADHRSSYGYLRAEVLGAVVNVAIIWTLAVLLILEAIERFRNPVEVQGLWVIGVGALGLIVNLVILQRFHHHSHDHSSIALKAARLHVFSDTLGSVGATLSGVGIWWLGLTWLDPLVTFLISGAMLVLSWGILRKTMAVLMEFAPADIDVPEVERALAGLPGVESIHDLHVWSLSVGKPSASAHLLVRQGDPQVVCRQATELLRTRFGLFHTTLQIEASASDGGGCDQDCV